MKEFDLELETDENLHPYYRYPDQAEAYLEYLKEQSFQRLPVKEEVRTLGNIGMTSLFLGKLNDAQYYLEKAVKLSDYNKNPDLIEFYIQQSIRLATVFQWKKNFQKSDDLFKQIISLINKEKKDSIYLDFVCQHYGKSLFDQKLYTKAKSYFQQALDIRLNKGNQSLIESSMEALHLSKAKEMLEHSSFKDLSKEHFDILELETINMIPLLEQAGVEHDPFKLVEGLHRPHEIITYYRGDLLHGVIRFSMLEGNVARVWSFQLRNSCKSKIAIRPLLKKTAKVFKDNGIQLVISRVHFTNENSIAFHEKLGFCRIGGDEETAEYELKLENVTIRLKK